MPVYFYQQITEVTGLLSDGITNLSICSLAMSGTNIFAASLVRSISYQQIMGANWTAINNGITNLFILQFAVSGTNIFDGTSMEEYFYLPTTEPTGLRLITD